MAARSTYTLVAMVLLLCCTACAPRKSTALSKPKFMSEAERLRETAKDHRERWPSFRSRKPRSREWP